MRCEIKENYFVMKKLKIRKNDIHQAKVGFSVVMPTVLTEAEHPTALPFLCIQTTIWFHPLY